ncbi:hypothetical protein KKD62_02675 [Patescibacteria group bacterium]|nr:hypothetical protein [Patescibacteria group bacterium]MBU1931844.1 hypothetical protein [Patescibacteria group bacterium]
MKPQRGIANIVLLIGVVLVSLVIPITRNLVQRGVKLPFAVVDDGGGSNPVTPPPPPVTQPPTISKPVTQVTKPPEPDFGSKIKPSPAPKTEPKTTSKTTPKPEPALTTTPIPKTIPKTILSPEPIKCEYSTGKDCDMALPCRTSCELDKHGCWFCPEAPITPKDEKILIPCDSCMNASYCDPDTMITQTECELDGLVCCERKPTLQITPTIYCLGGTFKTKEECNVACGDCQPKGHCWECPVRSISEPPARICFCDKPDFRQKLKDQLGINVARTRCSWFETEEIPSKDKVRSDDRYCIGKPPGLAKPVPQSITSTPRPKPVVSLEECDVPAGYSFPQVKSGSCVAQATCDANCPSGKIKTYTALEGNIYRSCCEPPLPPEISEPSESPSEPPKPVSEPSSKPPEVEPIIPKPTPNPDGCYCHIFGMCYFMSDSNVDNNGFWKMVWWRLQDDPSRCD